MANLRLLCWILAAAAASLLVSEAAPLIFSGVLTVVMLAALPTVNATPEKKDVIKINLLAITHLVSTLIDVLPLAITSLSISRMNVRLDAIYLLPVVAPGFTIGLLVAISRPSATPRRFLLLAVFFLLLAATVLVAAMLAAMFIYSTTVLSADSIVETTLSMTASGFLFSADLCWIGDEIILIMEQ